MQYSLSLRNWKRGAPAAIRRTPTYVRQPSGFRPWLETLESRRLLSTLTVSSVSDSGSGSLRAEIAAAQSGDTIVFAASLNGKTITLTSGELDLTKNLTIQGPGASQLTISGNNTTLTTHASRVFEVAQNTTVTLSGMTINDHGVSLKSWSVAVKYGGGILNHGTLTITGSTLTDNHTYGGDGGAIFSDGTLTITGSTLSGRCLWRRHRRK